MRTLPDYLIQKDSNINESKDLSKVLYFNHGTNGSMTRSQDPLPSNDYIHTARSIQLEVDEDFSQDFTLEVLYKGSLNLLNFNGDNNLTSRTSFTINSTYLTYYYWARAYAYKLRNTDFPPDQDGFTSLTVVRKGPYIRFYQHGILQVTIPVSNRFGDPKVVVLNGSYTIKRFSLSMGVALPRELHFDQLDRFTSKGDDNLKLVNIDHDVYNSSVFESRMVRSIYSYDQYIFVTYNDDTMEAAYRPRGTDLGNNISNIQYDHLTKKLKITLNDSKVFEFTNQFIEVDKLPLPEGSGYLTSEGKHKRLVIGDGFLSSDNSPSTDTFIKSSVGDSVPADGAALISAVSNGSVNLNYRKRLLLELIAREGKLVYPKIGPTLFTGKEEWEDLLYESRASTLRYFEIGNLRPRIERGKYLLRGFFTFARNNLKYNAFRIRVNGKTVFSKTCIEHQGVLYRTNREIINFEKVLSIPEDGEITIEQFQPDFGEMSTSAPYVLSKIEFFRL